MPARARAPLAAAARGGVDVGVDGDGDDDGAGEESEEEEEEEEEQLYCAACNKRFTSEGQWRNHERSKKHLEVCTRSAPPRHPPCTRSLSLCTPSPLSMPSVCLSVSIQSG